MRSPHGMMRPWATAVILSGCYAVAFIDRALVGVTGPYLQKDLGIGNLEFGLLGGTAFAILFCLCSIPLGYVADRWNRKYLILLGLLFWTAMTAACGLSRSALEFATARVGLGLGEACLVPAGAALLADVMPPGTLGRAISLFLLGATAGNILAFLGGGLALSVLEKETALLPLAPWRMLFLLACAPGIAVAGLLAFLWEPRPGKPHQASFFSACRYLWRNRASYGFLTVATACNIVLTQVPLLWLPVFLTRHFHVVPAAAAILTGLAFLASAPAGQIAGGMLLDRLHGRDAGTAPLNLLAICAAAALAPVLLFWLGDRPSVAVTGYALFNVAVYAATPAGMSGWQLLTPLGYRSTITAILVALVTFFGVGVGTPAVGFFSNMVFEGAGALGKALGTILGLSCLGVLLSALAGRRLHVRSSVKGM